MVKLDCHTQPSQWLCYANRRWISSSREGFPWRFPHQPNIQPHCSDCSAVNRKSNLQRDSIRKRFVVLFILKSIIWQGAPLANAAQKLWPFCGTLTGRPHLRSLKDFLGEFDRQRYYGWFLWPAATVAATQKTTQKENWNDNSRIARSRGIPHIVQMVCSQCTSADECTQFQAERPSLTLMIHRLRYALLRSVSLCQTSQSNKKKE